MSYSNAGTFVELRSLVKGLLDKPLDREWTLQGFGMLRAHFSDECRLNIWDDRYAIPEYKDASSVHTHPWDFTSTIVAGVLIDRSLAVDTRLLEGEEYNGRCVDITPGIGGGEKAEPYSVLIHLSQHIRYVAGEQYASPAARFHQTIPIRGAVTVNTRTRVGEDEAKVAWFGDGPWISAEPRVATEDEILDIVTNALASF